MTMASPLPTATTAGVAVTSHTASDSLAAGSKLLASIAVRL